MTLLVAQGRLDEARREVEREAQAAAASGARSRDWYVALSTMSRAWVLFTSGNFEQAGLALEEVPVPLRDARWLKTMHQVHLFTGQLGLAWTDCLQLSQPALGHFQRADGLYCQLQVLIVRAGELPAAANTSRIEEVARAARQEAEAGGNPTVAALASSQLVMLAKRVEAARLERRRCLEVAPGESERRVCRRAFIRWQVSSARQDSGEPAGAVRSLEGDDPVSRAEGYGVLMRLAWRTRPVDDFVLQSQQGLSQIERLRALQRDPEIQMSLLSAWSDDSYWFSGRLFASAFAGRCPSCLELGFGVVERLRARALYDNLIAAGAGAPAAEADAERLHALGQAIEHLRQRRQDSALPGSERENAESDLKALTAEEREMGHGPSASSRAEVSATANDRAATPHSVRPLGSIGQLRGFATLSEIQGLLAPDQALLSFQIAPWEDWTGDFGGGSWLIVATKAMRRCYRLEGMGRGDVRRGVAEFLEHREHFQSWQATDLYRQLVGQVLAELPKEVNRLVVVPDDHLHLLPFAALRATREGEVLAWRYQISVVPSATLWALTRATPQPPPADRPALVLADPPIPAPAVRKTFEAAGIHLPAERLPAAQGEANALVWFLGWRCERWVGNEASEEALLGSREPLSRFALVHFAAHSIVDDRDPRRSGIWLSPSPGRDGLLRPADIAKLRLDDRLVVLSTCSSNGGPFFRGEGVMSLAHAFFQARARTVVASLWPQVDTDAEALFTGFYRHLGQGASVAAALRQAQLDSLRQHPRLPPAAWAGMVVLGDGDLVPFPGGRHPWRALWLVAATVALSLLSLLALFVARVRRGGATA